MAVYVSEYSSPFGRMTLAGDGEALTGLWFFGQKYYGAGLPDKRESAELPVFIEAKRWLGIYFSGKEPDFTPRLRLAGTPFQKEVWEILLTVPYGRTTTYKEIAETIAQRRGTAHMSAQAVGGAVGRNPVSVIVPCHRVIGSDGSLTGYAGGVEIKKALLDSESKSILPASPEIS